MKGVQVLLGTQKFLREQKQPLYVTPQSALYQASKGILRKVNKLVMTALRLAAARKLSAVNEAILLDAAAEALL